MNGEARDFFHLTGLRPYALVLLALNALATGGLGAAVIALLAHAVNQRSGGWPEYAFAGLFVALVVAFVWFQHAGARSVAHLTEAGCAAVREHLLRTVLRAPLLAIEGTGFHIKRTLLTRDAAQLTNVIPTVSALIGSTATALGCIAYLAWLSASVAALVCVVIAASVFVYQALSRGTLRRMRLAYDAMDGSLGFADDLFLGTKQLKLEQDFADRFMRDDLVASLHDAARQLAAVKTEQQDLGLVGVVAFYGLTGAVVFGGTRWLQLDETVATTVVLVLLYLQTQVHAVVQRLPGFSEARHAQQRLLATIGLLGAGAEDADASGSGPGLHPQWQTLRLEGLGFSYPGTGADAPFSLKDISLEVKRGTVVFIVGGNGSGKTTLAKMLLGLYRPSEGRILLDGRVIDDDVRLAYRSLFNAVFSDTHLFRRRLQGMGEEALREITRILEILAITLRFTRDQRVDVTPFSQGQKRRLASAFVLADDKPMCLFDEWTADQDPEFRQFFYREFLPALRARGKTLFVITHDDRHFSCADMVVRLDAGRIGAVICNPAADGG